MQKNFDVLIIGAGPIGIACALQSKKKGLTYVVLEKGALCNSLYHYPLNMQFFSTSEKLEIDEIPFISANAKPNRNEALEYYRRVATSNELHIRLFEGVISAKKEGGIFKISSELNEYTAKHVIVSTGFYDIPFLLNIPGETMMFFALYSPFDVFISNSVSFLMCSTPSYRWTFRSQEVVTLR